MEGYQDRLYPLAMAIMPMQLFQAIHCPKDALEQGSIFCELILPFGGRTVRQDV